MKTIYCKCHSPREKQREGEDLANLLGCGSTNGGRKSFAKTSATSERRLKDLASVCEQRWALCRTESEPRTSYFNNIPAEHTEHSSSKWLSSRITLISLPQATEPSQRYERSGLMNVRSSVGQRRRQRRLSLPRVAKSRHYWLGQAGCYREMKGCGSN